jgi:hypothetical protein
MFVIIIPLEHAQTCKQGVRNVFIMTGVNKLYNNNSGNNNKRYATHEGDKFSRWMDNTKACGILEV